MAATLHCLSAFISSSLSSFSAHLSAISAHRSAYKTRSRFGVVRATCFNCSLHPAFLGSSTASGPCFYVRTLPCFDYLYPASSAALAEAVCNSLQQGNLILQLILGRSSTQIVAQQPLLLFNQCRPSETLKGAAPWKQVVRQALLIGRNRHDKGVSVP